MTRADRTPAWQAAMAATGTVDPAWLHGTVGQAPWLPSFTRRDPSRSGQSSAGLPRG